MYSLISSHHFEKQRVNPTQKMSKEKRSCEKTGPKYQGNDVKKQISILFVL